jgi:hypothetical protein
MRFLHLASFVFPFAALACGSSESSSPAPSSSSSPTASSSSPTDPAAPSACVAATKTLCQRACACGTAGTCVVAYSGGTVTEEHESLERCETFYAFYVCQQPAYAKEYDAACGAAIASASCVTTMAKGGAIALPDACHVSK